MPRITYIEYNGKEHVLDLAPGMSLMQGAVANDVRGIIGECRLSCQIQVTDALDGLVVRLPAKQV